MSNKTSFASGEADAWFQRNKQALEAGQTDEPTALLTAWLRPFKDDMNSILEIGCGTGHRLRQMTNDLDAKGSGVEPSSQAVDYIKREFPEFIAKTGFGDAVPFSSPFDLVHLGFFLYLVDRSDYLRCVSEADRLVKPGGFLSIVDFDTPKPYSNAYSHSQGVFAHKHDNAAVFVASGLYSVVNKFHFSHSAFHFDRDINERVSLTLLYKETDIFKGTGAMN